LIATSPVNEHGEVVETLDNSIDTTMIEETLPENAKDQLLDIINKANQEDVRPLLKKHQKLPKLVEPVTTEPAFEEEDDHESISASQITRDAAEIPDDITQELVQRKIRLPRKLEQFESNGKRIKLPNATIMAVDPEPSNHELAVVTDQIPTDWGRRRLQLFNRTFQINQYDRVNIPRTNTRRKCLNMLNYYNLKCSLDIRPAQSYGDIFMGLEEMLVDTMKVTCNQAILSQLHHSWSTLSTLAVYLLEGREHNSFRNVKITDEIAAKYALIGARLERWYCNEDGEFPSDIHQEFMALQTLIGQEYRAIRPLAKKHYVNPENDYFVINANLITALLGTITALESRSVTLGRYRGLYRYLLHDLKRKLLNPTFYVLTNKQMLLVLNNLEKLSLENNSRPSYDTVLQVAAINDQV